MNKPVALITGGSKGIGKAVATRLAKEGYNLVLLYLGEQPLAEALKDELEGAHGCEVNLLETDVSDLATIPRVLSYLDERSISVDALVLNAGLTDRASFEEMSFENWNRVFMANVHYPTFFIQQLGERLNEGASVVFTGSLMGIEPHSVSLVYGITKSAVHALVYNLVKFLSPRKVRVNGVAPGFVMTEWQKEKPEAIVNNICNKVAIGRFAEPDELTDAFWLLINNKYINGEVIIIDGGYSYR